MPDDADFYWDDTWGDTESPTPAFTDDDNDDDHYEDFGPAYSQGQQDAAGDYAVDDTVDDADAVTLPDDDDRFEMRTFDTGAFAADAFMAGMDAGDAPHPPREPAPVPRQPVTPFSTPLHRAPIGPTASARTAAPPRTASSRSTRRRSTRTAQTTRTTWVTLRTLLIVLAAAVLVSTIFSLWTRPDFFSDEFRAGLNQVQATQRVINIQPSPLPTETREIRIGVIAGHKGAPRDENFEVDPGAVCPDGLTELEINEAVARDVVAGLRRLEYQVDLLDEFDELLQGYQADVLVSIHTNDCQDYGDAGTGFSSASASGRQTTRGEDEFLLACLNDRYAKTTGLPQHFGVTYDMTSYHTFSEVAVDTPTAILELGFMNKDRAILTTQQPLLAQGIVNGILCFLQPDDGAGE